MSTIVHEDQDCLITYEEGNSNKCVVSFSGLSYGVGLSHWTGGKSPNLIYENSQDEFRKTLNSLKEVPHTYYVTDKGRCWYNNSSYETIKEVLPQEIDRHGFADIFTIGNSMGGFGAIIFAPIIPRTRRVIAFAPQSSVHPEHAPFENRWPAWREKIEEWKIADAVPALTETSYAIFFGTDDQRDLQHATRLAAASPVLVSEANHSVGKTLRERGVLYPMVEEFLDPSLILTYARMSSWVKRT